MQVKLKLISKQYNNREEIEQYYNIKNIRTIHTKDRWSPLNKYITDYRSFLKTWNEYWQITVFNKQYNISSEYLTDSLNNSKFKSIVNIMKNQLKDEIQSKRESIRNLNYGYGEFGRRCAGVYQESSLVFIRHQKKKLKEYFSSHIPSTTENHVGIEIECISSISKEELAFKLNERCPELINFVEIKQDGSLRPHLSNYNGIEIALLVPESRINELTEIVCSVLNENKCEINKTCGLHIHLDMRNRIVHQCYTKLVTFQSLLLKLQPKSRKGNYYCKRNISKQLNSDNDRSKYKIVNKCAYSQRTTLEIRVHSGTIQSEKIINWINILLRIINIENIPAKCPTSLKTLKNVLKLTPQLEQYIIKRQIDVQSEVA